MPVQVSTPMKAYHLDCILLRSAAVKDAILEELMKHKAAMSDARDKLQAKVDDDEARNIHKFLL